MNPPMLNIAGMGQAERIFTGTFLTIIWFFFFGTLAGAVVFVAVATICFVGGILFILFLPFMPWGYMAFQGTFPLALIWGITAGVLAGLVAVLKLWRMPKW